MFNTGLMSTLLADGVSRYDNEDMFFFRHSLTSWRDEGYLHGSGNL